MVFKQNLELDLSKQKSNYLVKEREHNLKQICSP